MEKRIGDGTGQGTMPPTKEGLSHHDGDEAGEDTGGGPPMHEGPQRTSPPHGGGKGRD